MTPPQRQLHPHVRPSRLIILLCAAVASVGTFLAYGHLTRGEEAEAAPHLLVQHPSLRFTSLNTAAAAAEAAAAAGASRRTDHPSADVHVVFSSSCSPSQDWQSFVLMYSAAQSGHRGPVTRIASGCTAEQQEELKQVYQKAFPGYHVHFTPDFSKDAATGKTYHFYNKPFGMRHWLANAEPPITEGLVALLDPDMIMTRPLTADLSADPNLIMHTKDMIAQKAGRGMPAGQDYSLGGAWTRKPQMFDKQDICGEDSPCLSTTEQEAIAHFAIGPPYIAHPDDMRAIANSWADFVPRVFKGYPQLLAEMYAYSMAAAHLNLPHMTVDNYMVSDIRHGPLGEGWPAIQRLPEICPVALNQYQGQGLLGPKRYDFPEAWLPPIIHYCQFYRLGTEGFNKRLVPNSLLTCESSKYLFEPDSSIAQLRHKDKGGGDIEPMSEQDAIRSTFMLCTIPRYINDAVHYYRRVMCGLRSEHPNDDFKTVRADHPRH